MNRELRIHNPTLACLLNTVRENITNTIHTLQKIHKGFTENHKNKNKLKTVHVNEVVTHWSYALAEFLVSSLFRAFPFPGNPSNVHIANVF